MGPAERARSDEAKQPHYPIPRRAAREFTDGSRVWARLHSSIFHPRGPNEPEGDADRNESYESGSARLPRGSLCSWGEVDELIVASHGIGRFPEKILSRAVEPDRTPPRGALGRPGAASSRRSALSAVRVPIFRRVRRCRRRCRGASGRRPPARPAAPERRPPAALRWSRSARSSTRGDRTPGSAGRSTAARRR